MPDSHSQIAALKQDVDQILKGQAELPGFEPLKQLHDKLTNKHLFDQARLLLSYALNEPHTFTPEQQLTLGQKQVIATYKDKTLNRSIRLEQARDLLTEIDPPDSSDNSETLGIAGAIHKRIFERDNDVSQLAHARAYYQQGYQLSAAKGWSDKGYCAINFAYVLDQLALIAQSPIATDARHASDGDMATQVRKEIIAHLVDGKQVHGYPIIDYNEQSQNWWFLVTLAEAYLGLGDYDKAYTQLQKAINLEAMQSWQRESAAKQFARLLHLRKNGKIVRQQNRTVAQSEQQMHDLSQSELRLIALFFNPATADTPTEPMPQVTAIMQGKTGLALSGGGFRASLYHIGVLAALAEQDQLRHIEVISCVSGGSIIGMHYYLALKALLESKPDKQISQQDYIKLVNQIETDFLRGVQRNIRTRALRNPLSLLKMAFKGTYSLTKRIGELYVQELYSRLDTDKPLPTFMDQLPIYPCVAEKQQDMDFHPQQGNWQRSAKVPVLVINATTVNTGHNWQFTATWMGEPPEVIDQRHDTNYRLRRMYYDTSNPNLRVTIGDAVAASSCVPGLFPPLQLQTLYEGEQVTLVDGGVFDNQGTASLLEQDCDSILTSDASGQLEAHTQPSQGRFATTMRTSEILQARLRSAQHRELKARTQSGQLNSLMYIHLKQDLCSTDKDWIGAPSSSPAQTPTTATEYGIQRDYQQAIASLRTDLDSFSDNEAFALMYSGYCMTRTHFKQSTTPTDNPNKWRFKASCIAKDMVQPEPKPALLKQLKVGSKLFFKAWYLSKPLKYTFVFVFPLCIALLSFPTLFNWVKEWQPSWLSSLKDAASFLFYAILTGVLGTTALTILHLLVFDRVFLRKGRDRPRDKDSTQ
ncbi:patatin-like phospholipase family protein [Pseudoalteromonas rubra]|nr:patatin-like phospholipase family protein [Pseudoalteromonas rubra]